MSALSVSSICIHAVFAQAQVSVLLGRYAGGAQSRASASGIKLVAKAKGTSHSSQQQHKPTRPVFTAQQLAEQQRVKKLQQQAKERETAAAAAKAAAEAEKAAEKEKEAQRKWILQYAEDDSESESDEDSHSRVSRNIPWLSLCV